jgi:hypothetical protein
MNMDFRNLHIGDIIPAPTSRGIWHHEWEPSWHIFQVPPRGELPATAWLTRNGVSECWHPTETAYKRNRFKPGKRIPYERPVAPGYLFAVLPQRPHWDVLFARSRGKLLRVVSHNGDPVAVPEETIAAMAQVPQRLASIREAEAAKRRLNPGDKATVSIAGIEWQVTVDRIHAGIAHFVVPLLGGREVQAPVETLRKDQPLA